ncbi:hypothetical protein LTR86_010094 [Recurvomyces mirabilis]|nr:hypothetical protein LTR86_010094 [Recurvomyces mirabilis]
MPFTDGVSSMSGRNSRASNVSGMTGSVRSAPPPVQKSNDMFSNAGVLSMLKTSTDTGDIGALSFNQGRLPTMPRPAHQRRGHASRPSQSNDLPRPSGASHHYPGGNSHHRYAPSQTSRISDSTSFMRRGSLTSMQSMPPSLPPIHNGKAPLQVPAPVYDTARDSRSYSMTSAPISGQLPRHQSATSLKSAGHEPRNAQRMLSGNVPPMPENRPPYVYPTRLKRPGYRSPSPALSDLSAQGQFMPPMVPGNVRLVAMQRPPMPTYNSEFGAQDAHYLNVRPPPRAMNSSPVMPYEQPQFAYRPNAMRSDPGLPMGPPMPQQRRQPMYGPPPARSGYPGQYYGPPRPGYAAYPMQHPSYGYPAQRGPPPIANMMPMAHNMFHNAARMARHLPSRTDTPLTDVSPPSSDPPSSGTAPSSSSPPTPKDGSTIHVAVDPLFIDPALTDLPDSSSEPVLAAKYFAYAEGLEKTIDEPDVEIAHPSMAPTGFVQRVKAMLESRAAVEAAARKEDERDRAAAIYDDGRLHHALLGQHDNFELVELDAAEESRFVILEEFDAPVELPASPVKLVELSTTPPRPQQELRLTREMIKAELAASSTAQDSSGDVRSPMTIDEVTKPEHNRQTSKHTSLSHQTTSNKQGENPKPSPSSTLETPGIRRQPSTTESAQTASPEIISGIDYALRFSAPIDTTVATTETQSKDPFVLDADTITLQHQRSKERVAPVQERRQSIEERNTQADISATPVSPLLPGEDVARYSAVSPLHTYTHGIDETLHAAEVTDDAHTEEITQTSTEALSPTEDSLPPPTPRTPKTYSKSVQLPHNSVTTTETPSTNRYSLPPDLSTVADSTMNTNSEMITDVAVRFSLPTTTITIGKPQIVTIPPSSSPEKPESPPPKSKARGLQPKGTNRNSVTFADQVPPLNINKVESRRESYFNEPAIGKGKSISRRAVPLDDSFDSGRATSSRESTTELRFPNNGLNSRFSSTHLPGLKEESIEDMSISDKQKRSSHRTESQQLTLPARIAAVKAMQERRLQESADKAKARRAARHYNRTLAEARDLPSLNFSRMDLIDKLNEALEIRPSKSLEVVRRRDFSGIYCPSPQRPQSTEPLRERYASFFSKPEDFTFFDDPSMDDLDDEQALSGGIPIVEIQESTRIEGGEQTVSNPNSKPGSRALSPEDLLSVATQVNRLSIPSVTGLSDKITSILPALRNLQLDSILSSSEGFAQALEELHSLGGSRPETVLSTRTSAGFRTLAERAEEIVQHGTHDSVVPTSRLLLVNKELPPLPESASADKVSAISTIDGKLSYLSGSVSAPTDLGKDVARPSSALVRQRSPLSEDEVRQLLPPEMNPITRSKRSLIISSASRPWNQDENYPWAGKDVPVDLTIPSETHTRDSVIGELHRRAKSVDVSTTLQTIESPAGIDIGSILTTDDGTASITTERATGVNTNHNRTSHNRKPSKRSIIGSITKKISLPGCSKRMTDDTTASSLPSPPLNSDSGQPHKPGDRYPTSALTPPVNLHLDELRSFFSDNSSERQRRAHSSFRKRLTGLSKQKIKSVRLDATRGASLDDTAYDAGSLNAERERLGAVSSAETVDGIAMGKAEFRIKKLGERLRHLWVRGGDLIRSLSGRGEKVVRRVGGTAREDWLSDSFYSGV